MPVDAPLYPVAPPPLFDGDAVIARAPWAEMAVDAPVAAPPPLSQGDRGRAGTG